MSTEVLKLEKDLCRCCHSEGSYKSLYAPYFWLGVEEVLYSDMLRNSFSIELEPVSEPLSQLVCSICDVCINKLREATMFKQQVLKCEKRFRDVFLGSACKSSTLEVEVKQELLDQEDVDSERFNVDGHSDTIKLEPNDCSKIHYDDDALEISDDDRRICYEDDFKWDGEENLPLVKKVKRYRKRKYTKSKRKVGRPRKNAVPPKEEVVETMQGDINASKRPRPLVDKDYKQVGDEFHCCHCNKTNKILNTMQSHIKRIHFKVPKHTCSLCSKEFRTTPPFVRHKLEEHNIDERVKCNACDTVFNTRVQLKRHTNSFHMLGEKYKCQVCDFESFSVESLYKHKFKHKTVKDNHCKYCNKSFLRKTTMRLHERIHTGDRRKVCQVCGQAFVQKASLNYHMTKYHPEVDF